MKVGVFTTPILIIGENGDSSCFVAMALLLLLCGF